MFKRGFTILMALFLALIWLSPVQTVSAASDTATFSLTASPNPSLYLVNTTFTLSATGTNSTYPPFGTVDFYDDGTAIVDCTDVPLNIVEPNPTAGLPATCTINSLPIGTHTITAYFTSGMTTVYDSQWVAMDNGRDQTVNYTALTISPDVLPDGQWMLGYLQTLSASGGDGSYEWSYSGNLPTNLILPGNTGEISGTPSTIDEFTFTVTVVDYAGGYGTKEYTLNITTATPDVYMTISGADSLYADTAADITIFTTLDHPNTDGSIAKPEGTVSYLVDGVEVPACSGGNAKILDDGGTHCMVNTAGLTSGTHTVQANYTPTDAYYATASGETTFYINPARYYDIAGRIFYDVDLDGVYDDTESPASKGFEVNYDIGCDGTADQTVWTVNNSNGDPEYSFANLTSGSSFCLVLTLATNEVQTTTVGPITLDEDKSIDIGVYYIELVFSPEDPPVGAVNVPYSQTITIVSGGTAPYTVSFDPTKIPLPDGMSFDPTTLTLSGTPTIGFTGPLYFEVVDDRGFSDYYSGDIFIQTPGTFTLTSSANPSASGEDVTFTYTGTGNAVLSYSLDGLTYTTMPIAPVGMVDFYVDGVAVDTCQDIFLNLDASWNFGDYPATCTVSSLADGTHTISVVYADWMSGLFTGETDLSLTQVVGVVPDTTPPGITPTVTGTLGSGGWYTSDVTLTWTVTDDESEITSQTGCDPVNVTSDQAETTYTCSATSEGGTASVDATIQRDATQPVTTITGVEDGATYGLGSVPTAACSTTDALSGVATEAALSLSGGDSQGLGEITATCSGALDVAGNAADSVSVTYTVERPADLKITLIDSSDPVKAKSALLYALTVTNLGPNKATNITITDTLDPMTSFVLLAGPKGWSCNVQSGVITCTGASLASGKKASFIIATVVSRYAVVGSTLVNTASVSSDTFDSNLSNNSYTQTTVIAKSRR